MEQKFCYEQKNKKFFVYFLIWALETEISGMGGASGSSAEVATMAAISLSYVKEDGSVTAITTEEVLKYCRTGRQS